MWRVRIHRSNIGSAAAAVAPRRSATTISCARTIRTRTDNAEAKAQDKHDGSARHHVGDASVPAGAASAAVRRPAFPSLRARPSDVAVATPNHLLLLQRLAQLEEAGKSMFDRRGGDTDRAARAHADQVCSVVDRLLSEQRASSGLPPSTPRGTTPTPTPTHGKAQHAKTLTPRSAPLASGASSTPPPFFTLSAHHLLLILTVLRQLPATRLPIHTVDAVWDCILAHATSNGSSTTSTGTGTAAPPAGPSSPPSSSQSQSPQLLRPPILMLNQVIDLYSTLSAPDRAWEVWCYICAHDLGPTIITVNTLHTSILRRMTLHCEGFGSLAAATDRKRFREVWQKWEEIGSAGRMNVHASSSDRLLAHSSVPVASPFEHDFKPIRAFFDSDEALRRSTQLPHGVDSSRGDIHFNRNLLLYFLFTGDPLRAAAHVELLHAEETAARSEMTIGRDAAQSVIDLSVFRTSLGALERHMRQADKRPLIHVFSDGVDLLSRPAIGTIATCMWTFFTATVGLVPDGQLVAQQMRILHHSCEWSSLVRLGEWAADAQVRFTPNMQVVTAKLVLGAVANVKREVIDAIEPVMGDEDGVASRLDDATRRVTARHLAESAAQLAGRAERASPMVAALLAAPATCKLAWYVKHRVLVPLVRGSALPEIDQALVSHLARAYQREDIDQAQQAERHRLQRAQLDEDDIDTTSHDGTTPSPPPSAVWTMFTHLCRAPLVVAPKSLCSIEFFETVLASLADSATTATATAMTPREEAESMTRALALLNAAESIFSPLVTDDDWRPLRAIGYAHSPHQLGFGVLANGCIAHCARFAAGSSHADHIFRTWFMPTTTATTGAVIPARLTTTPTTLRHLLVGYLRGGRSSEDVSALLQTCSAMFDLRLDSLTYESAIVAFAHDSVGGDRSKRARLARAALKLLREMTNREMAPTSDTYRALLQIIARVAPTDTLQLGALALPPWKMAQHIMREMHAYIKSTVSPTRTTVADAPAFRITADHFLSVLLTYDRAIRSQVDTATDFLAKALHVLTLIDQRPAGREAGSATQIAEAHRIVSRIMRTNAGRRVACVTDAALGSDGVVPPISAITASTPLVPSLLALYSWAASHHRRYLFANEWTLMMRSITGHMRTLKSRGSLPPAASELDAASTLVTDFCHRTIAAAEDGSMTLTGDIYASLIAFHTFSSSTPRFESVWGLFSRSQLLGVEASPQLTQQLFRAMRHFGQWTSLVQLYRNMHLMEDVRKCIPSNVHHAILPWLLEWADLTREHDYPEAREVDASIDRVLDATSSATAVDETTRDLLIQSPYTAARKILSMRWTTAATPTQHTTSRREFEEADLFDATQTTPLSAASPTATDAARHGATFLDYWQWFQLLLLEESRLAAIGATRPPAVGAMQLPAWRQSSETLPEWWESELSSRHFWPYGGAHPNWIDLTPLQATMQRVAASAVREEDDTDTTTMIDSLSSEQASLSRAVDRMQGDHVSAVLQCAFLSLALRQIKSPPSQPVDIFIRVHDDATATDSLDLERMAMRHLALVGVSSPSILPMKRERIDATSTDASEPTPSVRTGRIIRIDREEVEQLVQRIRHQRQRA